MLVLDSVRDVRSVGCRAVTAAAGLRQLTARTRVQFQDSPYAICGGQSE